MEKTIVQTHYGKIEGEKTETSYLFRGVPYAAPPINENRWQNPKELEPWQGILKTQKFGARCPQLEHEGDGFYQKEFYDDPSYIPEEHEDCLYLNIWTPQHYSVEKNFPVAVWIHGGAFIGGHGSEKEFDGAALNKQNVILVTINYRVGVLGFFSHPWLAEESSTSSSGNYGVFDQLHALKWVYENIDRFGGDPSNITVFGQSAGSMSTQILVSSDLTTPYIAKTILQSGGGYHSPLTQSTSLEDSFKIGEAFVNTLSIDSLTQLRLLPVQDILSAAKDFHYPGVKLPFSPIIDGVSIKGDLDECLQKGAYLDIPYLLGSTEKDILSKEVDASECLPPLYQATVDWSVHNKHLGRKANYVYFFTQDLPGDAARSFHSSELWYIFGTLERSWRPFKEADYQLSKEMIQYWSNFMRTGDPNDSHLPTWYRCEPETRFVKELNQH